MPIFEYKCSKCGATRDRIVKYEDRKKEVECPVCFNGKLQLNDKVHSTNVSFKGSGWFNSGGY